MRAMLTRYMSTRRHDFAAAMTAAIAAPKYHAEAAFRCHATRHDARRFLRMRGRHHHAAFTSTPSHAHFSLTIPIGGELGVSFHYQMKLHADTYTATRLALPRMLR